MVKDQTLTPPALPTHIDTLTDVLRYRSQVQGDDELFIFLEKGETPAQTFTYASLDRRARAIAATLQAQGLTGERALLLFPSSLDYLAAFFGCLYAGVTAVPVYPPQMGKQWQRIQAIIADSRPAVFLTNRTILEGMQTQMPEALDDLQQAYLVTDDIDDQQAEAWTAPALGPDSLAFLQYTSGSTGQPKGVRVTHGNLMANEATIQRLMAPPSGPVIMVSWLPLFHDMGLIGGALFPLYQGGRAYLMTPLAFLQSPRRWLQAVSTFGANVSGAPNFAYDICAAKISASEREGLDLRNWRIAFNGAEPVRAETLRTFQAHFAPVGFQPQQFMPCYGMAETTLLISAEEAEDLPRTLTVDREQLQKGQARLVAADRPEAQELVSCGYPFLDMNLRIVNPDTHTAAPEGQVGEVWVRGLSICDGYWERPEVNAEIFGAHLRDTGEGPWLRTGDLGFVLGGHLYLTSRLKDLIIIRGRNHYPPDIEETVEKAHPGLLPSGGAAFSVEVAGEERLVIVQEIERGTLRQTPAETLFQLIRQAIGDVHEIQPYAITLIQRRTLPKTSSGKVQRRAARQAWESDDFKVEAAWVQPLQAVDATPLPQAVNAASLEQWIRTWMAAKLDLRPGDIDLYDPISAYGLDSMMMVEFEDQISAFLGVEWPVRDLLLTEPTIEEVISRGLEAHAEARG